MQTVEQLRHLAGDIGEYRRAIRRGARPQLAQPDRRERGEPAGVRDGAGAQRAAERRSEERVLGARVELRRGRARVSARASGCDLARSRACARAELDASRPRRQTARPSVGNPWTRADDSTSAHSSRQHPTTLYLPRPSIHDARDGASGRVQIRVWGKSQVRGSARTCGRARRARRRRSRRPRARHRMPAGAGRARAVSARAAPSRWRRGTPDYDRTAPSPRHHHGDGRGRRGPQMGSRAAHLLARCVCGDRISNVRVVGRRRRRREPERVHLEGGGGIGRRRRARASRRISRRGCAGTFARQSSSAAAHAERSRPNSANLRPTAGAAGPSPHLEAESFCCACSEDSAEASWKIRRVMASRSPRSRIMIAGIAPARRRAGRARRTCPRSSRQRSWRAPLGAPTAARAARERPTGVSHR